jgi:K+-transporting ATPase ATPase B chain
MKNSTIKKSQKTAPALDQSQIAVACWIAVKKLNPRSASKSPVMFVVLIGTLLSAGITLQRLFAGASFGFELTCALILLFTVWFAKLAEAIA